jgi:hypothetical protein
MSYGIIFRGNSSYSSVLFKIQKRVIRMMMGCVYGESCRKLFKDLKILLHSSDSIFSLLLYIFNNRDYCASNSVYYSNNTRQRIDLHLPEVTLAMHQKGSSYSGINIFSAFLKAIKDISCNFNRFRIAIKHFLCTRLFYMLGEFFNKQ